MPVNHEYLQASKDIIRGALLGLSAYIKPGGLHRLAPDRVYDEVACNLVSSIDFIILALEVGNNIRKGAESLVSIDLGKLLADSTKEAFRACGSAHPQYIIPLVVGALCIGHSGVESIINESSKFKRSLELVSSIDKGSSIKRFISVLKTVNRSDMYDHLNSLGYTELSLMHSSVSFNDIYRGLGSRWRGFLIVESREAVLFTYLNRMVELYKKHGSLSESAVALYMEIVKPHIPRSFAELVQKVESCGYMATPECSRLMLELDVNLRKNKYTYEWASEIVVLTSAFASFEGLK